MTDDTPDDDETIRLHNAGPLHWWRHCESCNTWTRVEGTTQFGPTQCFICRQWAVETTDPPAGHDDWSEVVEYDGRATITRLPA